MTIENSKAVTGFHAVQADPATHCVEKNGQEESHDPPAPQKLGLWGWGFRLEKLNTLILPQKEMEKDVSLHSIPYHAPLEARG